MGNTEGLGDTATPLPDNSTDTPINQLIYKVLGCWHEQQAVPVGDFAVWASSWNYSFRFYEKDKAKFAPDLFVALDPAWLDDTAPILTNDPKIKTPPQLIPVLYAQWNDGARLATTRLIWLVQTLQERILQGQKIEIGCIGGHGRTGVLIACLIGAIEGLNAGEAFRAVRERYCNKAVETETQLKSLYKLLGGSKKSFKKNKRQVRWSVPYSTTTYYHTPDTPPLQADRLDGWSEIPAEDNDA